MHTLTTHTHWVSAKKTLLFILFFSTFSFASEASAASFYVDSAVSSSGNGTSWASAWKNFSNINWGSIKPGDTLYISGGSSSKTYTGSLVIGAAGTAGNPITITRGIDDGHNGTPVLDGQNGGSNWYGVDNGYGGTPRNYVVVSKLKIQNYASAGLHARSVTAGVIYEKNEVITGTVTTDNPRAMDIRNTTGIIVRDNKVWNSGTTPGQTDGLWSSDNNNFLYEGNDINITNANGYGHSDCIQSFQDYSGTMRGNIVRSPAAIEAGDNKVVWIEAIRNGSTISFYNNVTISRGTQTNIGYGRASDSAGHGTLLVYNNTIIGGWRAVSTGRVTNIQVKNNIIVPDSDGYGLYSETSNMPASSVTNNLVFGTSKIAYLQGSGDQTWAQWIATGYNANGVNVDPKFTNAASEDYTLQTTSPAIDKGTTLTTVTTDKNGTTRPQGSAYDIGAYEGTTSGTPTCTLTHPSASPPATGFGASWNQFTSAKELILLATCSGSNLNVTAGNSDATTYVYKTGYRWANNAWQPYTLSGSTPSGDWFKTSATASIPKLTGTTYFVGYTCQRVSGTWKCGCSDTTCTTGKWQLQGVE